MFSEPVEPIITMSALPPYWVRFELRKKLVVTGWPAVAGLNADLVERCRAAA